MRLGGVVIVVLLGLLLAPAAQAAGPHPVPWDVTSVFAGGANPDQVAGANDWSCRPSAEHPEPVVLVHGFVATQGTNWPTMSPLLANNEFCVFALTYGRYPSTPPQFGGFTPMEKSAEQLRAFVDRVLRETGASKVDLVGHSQGTIMPRWYTNKLGGADKVDDYVMFTPLWDGTNLAGIGTVSGAARVLYPGSDAGTLSVFDALTCGACPQFAQGSDYLKAVDAVGKALPQISYTNIVTRYDELVVPYTSGLLPDAANVKNFVLQDVCAQDTAEHLAVAYDPHAAQLMLNALDPARAKPVQCTVMTPAGAPNPPDVGLAPRSGSSAPRSPSAAPAACTTAKPLRISVPRRRGERVRSVVARVRGKRVATAEGRNVRRIRIPGLKPGRTAISLLVRTRDARRTVVVRRTAAC